MPHGTGIITSGRRAGLLWAALCVVVGWGASARAQSWVLTGQAVDPSGAGIPGVVLAVTPIGGITPLLLTGETSGPDGSFTTTIAETISPGDYDVRLNGPPGHVDATVTVTLSGSADLGVVTLADGWVITGLLLDPAGAPLPGIDLDLYPAGTTSSIPLQGDLTQADGTFAVTVQDPIPVGFYDLRFQPPAGAPYFELVVPDIFFATSVDVGTHSLETAYFISGTCVDDAGVGVEGVNLDVFDLTGTLVPTPGDMSDPTGAFQIMLPAGSFDIRFTPPVVGLVEYVPVYLTAVPVTADVPLGDVVLHDGITISGFVTDSLGNPVDAASIDIFDPVTGDVVYTPGDFTDPTGAWSVLVPAGDWIVQVDPPAGVSLVSEFLDISVLPPPASGFVGTTVLPDGLSVIGSVQDGLGNPVPGTDLDFVISATGVEIYTAHDNADSAGLFTVLVQADTYDIQFKPDFLTGLAPLVLPSTVVATDPTDLGAVTLPPGNALTGTVTSSGLPVADVRVTLNDSVTGVSVYAFGNKTDLTGAYALRQVPGLYDVTFTPPALSGLAPTTVTGIDLSTDVVLDAVLVGGPVGDLFQRGDSNNDGIGNVADAIFIINYSFVGGVTPPCQDAADANDDGTIDIADVIYLIQYFFNDGAPPPAPFPACGVDATETDGLDCLDTSVCL